MPAGGLLVRMREREHCDLVQMRAADREANRQAFLAESTCERDAWQPVDVERLRVATGTIGSAAAAAQSAIRIAR